MGLRPSCTVCTVTDTPESAQQWLLRWPIDQSTVEVRNQAAMKTLLTLNELNNILTSAHRRHAQLKEKFTSFAHQAEQVKNYSGVPDLSVTPLQNECCFITKFLDQELSFNFSSKLPEEGMLTGVISCYALKKPEKSLTKVGDLAFHPDGRSDLPFPGQDGDFIFIGHDVHTQWLMLYFIHKSLALP